MAAFSSALVLLGGVIGAGFASGREIVRFFAMHGSMAFAAAAAAILGLAALFFRLSGQLSVHCTLPRLCAARLGARFGRLCSGLFALLCAVTGGAMLAACAELGALVLPLRHAYGFSLAASLLLSILLSTKGTRMLALPGAVLMLALPVLLLCLLRLDAGEACFLPAMTPDLPIRAAIDGAAYASLSAAQLAGTLSLLVGLSPRERKRTLLLFVVLFGAVLLLGVLVCLHHLPAIVHQPLPFVYLSRRLGSFGYGLTALSLYAAALSTLCAMQRALLDVFSPLGALSRLAAPLSCLILALAGFDSLVGVGYPMLSALCAGLLLVLCMPVCQSMSAI